ncbi:MAG: hypothetical protein U0599_19525 [Vicinamibacteria bacterium]
MTSLLSDELLSGLMAVGQVDVLVGLPTLNHADSVGAAARAAHVAFSRELARERTLLLNVDGGSTDGTPDIVRDASIVERETLLASQSLRTRHRISAPYHGVPGKAAALRVVFAAADLLQARAVVVLDPEVASVSAESVAGLARPALAGGADFVSPAYARHPLDGLLVTQVVRPLFRAAYGLGLQEPLAGELGCSGRFASRCLAEAPWGSDGARGPRSTSGSRGWRRARAWPCTRSRSVRDGSPRAPGPRSPASCRRCSRRCSPACGFRRPAGRRGPSPAGSPPRRLPRLPRLPTVRRRSTPRRTRGSSGRGSPRSATCSGARSPPRR